MPVAIHAIEAVVGMVRKVNHSVGDSPGASTVFMDSRADVEPLRRDIFARKIPRHAADHARPAAFLRARFQPIDFVAIQTHFGKSDGFSHDQVRSDGGFPEAVGSGCHGCLSHYDADAMIPVTQMHADKSPQLSPV